VKNGFFDGVIRDLNNNIQPSTKGSVVSLAAGLGFDIPLTKQLLHFTPSLGLSVKGESIYFPKGIKTVTTAIIEYETFTYYSAHIMLPFRIETPGKKVRVNFSLGPYIDVTPLTRSSQTGIDQGKKIVGTEWNVREYYQYVRPLNLGLVAGAGMQFKIFEFWLHVSYKYETSLVSPLKYFDATVTGHNIIIGASYPISSL
jgi:hypothetical protein